GNEHLDGRLLHAVQIRYPDPNMSLPEVADPIRVAMPDAPIIYMQGGIEMGQHEMALALCATQGLPLIQIDMAALVAKETPIDENWRLALREAYLNNGALLVDHWESALNEAR